MVAVSSAIQASDAALASELGSLCIAHTQIRDPRWRLEAIVRRVPALVRFGVSLDSTRAEIRALAAKATCPEPLREVLATQVEAAFEVGLVRALWTPDWRGSAQLAVDAARTSPETVEQIAQLATAHSRYATPRCERERTLVDLIALVDEGRADEAERAARELRPHELPFAKAHLARLDLRAGRTPRRLRGSHRSGADLLLVREAIARDERDLARSFADRIERSLIREQAYLEIANALVARGSFVEALRLANRVQRSELWNERNLLRAEVRLIVRRDRHSYPRGSSSVVGAPSMAQAARVAVDRRTRSATPNGDVHTPRCPHAPGLDQARLVLRRANTSTCVAGLPPAHRCRCRRRIGRVSTRERRWP